MSFELASTSAGLLGKAPCQAEFLRLNAQDPSCQILHRWLEDAVHQVRGAQVNLPGQPVFFAFSQPATKTTLVGALASSSDQVGRSFPLCIFASVASGAWAQGFPLGPLAFGPFLQGAASLLKEASQLNLTALTERLRLLSLPSASAMGAAEEEKKRMLQACTTDELVARLIEEGSQEGIYYAFRTFLAGCANPGTSVPVGGIVLDCPIPARSGPLFWLELSKRLLTWREGPPSFFWTEDQRARALICMGQPPTAVLLYLAKPDSKAAKLWPLSTSAVAAMAQAREALSMKQRQAIEQHGLPLERLLNELVAG